MNIDDFINSGKKVQVILEANELHDFAVSIAQMTASKIMEVLHTPDKPISEAEACKIYQRTRQTFSKYRKQGKIRYHLVGGGIVYFTRELEEDMKKL